MSIFISLSLPKDLSPMPESLGKIIEDWIRVTKCYYFFFFLLTEGTNSETEYKLGLE